MTFYEAGQARGEWCLFSVTEIGGEYVRVTVASFGSDKNAQWKAERAADRENAKPEFK